MVGPRGVCDADRRDRPAGGRRIPSWHEEAPGWDVFYLVGTYREVRPPEKLVYTWSWEGQPDFGETLVTVEFRDLGSSTEVVLTHEFFPNEEARQNHDKGWNSCLDRLAKAFYGSPRSEKRGLNRGAPSQAPRQPHGG